jgi:hypothetical protein
MNFDFSATNGSHQPNDVKNSPTGIDHSSSTKLPFSKALSLIV